MSKKALTDMLEAIKDSTENGKISFADIVRALNSRGFGALLVAPSIIIILPTGAIPGIPALCGLFIVLISAQLLIGRKYPWLPKRLKKASFDKEKYERALEKAKPYTEKIDEFFHPRFEFLTREPVQRVIAILCLLLSLVIISIGFIPLLPDPLALAILLFGLGISVHDGLITALGFLVFTAALILVPWMALNFFEQAANATGG